MLVLEKSVCESIVEHARRGTPEEVCGLLAGRSGELDLITRNYETANVAVEPRATYAIDPEEQYRLMTEIDETGLDLIGFYHSHPASPAEPSPIDRDRATWEGYRYLIVSLAGSTPVLDAWRLTGDGFERDTVSVRN
ncbi:MAG: desampylase [Halodesulfurarchaeum sp.]